MTDIKFAIEPDDIEWEMDWGDKTNSRGISGKEMVFEPAVALAHILLNEQVFINSYWWKYSKLGDRSADGNGYDMVPQEDAKWTEGESKLISVSVNCNDIFAWGCADSEELPHREIENVYRMWRKDPGWGTAVWCMIQRNQMPQKPVADRIRKGGIWDLEALKLSQNTMDDEVKALFASLRRSPEVTNGERGND